MPERLQAQYRRLKTLVAGAGGLSQQAVGELLAEMAVYARRLLQTVERMELISRVPGKRYYGFRRDGESRPVNEALYALENDRFDRLLERFLNAFEGATAEEIVTGTYTIAYSVMVANDVFNVGRKASATFFELLIGHIFSRVLGIVPRKKVRIPESDADLPTDYVFDLGRNRRKIHLPIKTSTRERGVQAWVHQLVLDRIFGTGAFRGVFVVASETKRNSRTGEVIEICVPRQLQMFQARVAEISRIYYLDAPQVYLELANAFPRVEIRSLGDLRGDIPAVLQL